jgi:chromosomal replication initiation ATPase DnaA
MRYYAVHFTNIVKIRNKTLDECFKIVSLILGVTPEQLKYKTRCKREVSDARFVFFKVARENTKCSTSEIGRYVNRDHATVLNGIKQLDEIDEIKQMYKKVTEAMSNE